MKKREAKYAPRCSIYFTWKKEKQMHASFVVKLTSSPQNFTQILCRRLFSRSNELRKNEDDILTNNRR